MWNNWPYTLVIHHHCQRLDHLHRSCVRLHALLCWKDWSRQDHYHRRTTMYKQVGVPCNTVPTATRSIWCTATPDQLQDFFWSVGHPIYHIQWNYTFISVVRFPPVVYCIKGRWISAQGRVPLSNLMMRSANVLLECFGCGRWTTQFWRGCWFSRLLCPLQLHALCHSTRLWTMLLVWLLWPYLLFLGRADPACNLFEPHSNCCCLANSIGRCNWITPSKSMERQDIRYDPSMFKSGGLHINTGTTLDRRLHHHGGL